MIPARIADRLVPIPDTGCMLWEGPCNEKGYGQVWFEGKTRRLIRVVFFLVHGRWPNGEVLHSCDTPACAAEWHLREGTRLENELDKQRKGRGRGHFIGGGRRAA